MPVARPRNYLLITCYKFFMNLLPLFFYTVRITCDIRKVCLTILCELCTYFACGHYLVLMTCISLRQVRKIIRVFNCGEFRHGEIDSPTNDNKRKDEMRG